MSASTADGLIGSKSEPPAERKRRGFIGFVFAELPYILILLAALGGTSYRAFYGQPILGYWKVLLIAFAVLCMWAGLTHAKTSRQVYALIWTQVLHWAAFYAAVIVLATSSVRAELDDDAISTLILTLLALALFLAGVHARAWRLGVVGIVLGLTVPAVTWLQTSATFISFCAAAFVVVVLAFFVFRPRVPVRKAA
jgi:hypothetical protein